MNFPYANAFKRPLIDGGEGGKGGHGALMLATNCATSALGGDPAGTANTFRFWIQKQQGVLADHAHGVPEEFPVTSKKREKTMFAPVPNGGTPGGHVPTGGFGPRTTNCPQPGPAGGLEPTRMKYCVPE